MKSIIHPFVFLLFSIILIYSGLRELIYKKPSIQDNRLMPLILLLIPFGYFIETKNLIITSVAIVFISILQVLVSKFNYGILLAGVDKVDFEKKFLETLESMGLNYELKKSSIEIQDPKLTMELSQLRSRYGVNLKLKKNSDKVLFKEIVSKLKNIEIKSDKTLPIISLIAGCILLVSGCISIFLRF
jgi:hypothetical protein